MIRDWLIAAFAGLLRQPSPAPADLPPRAYRIGNQAFRDTDDTARIELIRRTFEPARPPAFALPAGMAADEAMPKLAQDDASMVQAFYAFAINNSLFASGMAWPGYPYLSELAQIAEHRLIVETIAEEMTRKWIIFEAAAGTDKAEKIKDLEAACERYHLQDRFRRGEELDGYFGCGHLYVDIDGVRDDPVALKSPLIVDKRTIKRGSLRGFQPVEPMWTYPATYNANDPLRDDFFRPTAWYVMGKTVHRSRLLTFIGREMPDILKAAYSFGGMSLTQMAKPAVDYWLQTRTDVGRLVNNFSMMVLYTDMSAALSGGGREFMEKRAQIFNSFRSNSGLMFANQKLGADEGEKFENVAVPLTSLPELQQQAAEHMAFTAQEPLVKLLGITPSGLNASTDGEIRTFYDRMAAFQEKRFGAKLKTAIEIIQLSEWGEIDPDITWRFAPLWQLDEAGQAAVQKTKSDIAVQSIETGVLAPNDERKRLATDPESQYHGLDLGEEAPGTPDVDGEGKPINDPLERQIDRASVAAGGGANSGSAAGV